MVWTSEKRELKVGRDEDSVVVAVEYSENAARPGRAASGPALDTGGWLAGGATSSTSLSVFSLEQPTVLGSIQVVAVSQAGNHMCIHAEQVRLQLRAVSYRDEENTLP